MVPRSRSKSWRLTRLAAISPSGRAAVFGGVEFEIDECEWAAHRPDGGSEGCSPGRLRADSTGTVGQDLNPPSPKRRFPRVHGPFYAYYESRQTPVLVYDLNLGGGFVNFGGEQPSAVDFVLNVALPPEGLITVHAETVYRHKSGVAVRFVNVDVDTCERLVRVINTMVQQPPAH